MNCAICDKKLSFWNQPILNKGTFSTGDKVCSVCYLKINFKSPQTATNLKAHGLDEVKVLLGLPTKNSPMTNTSNDNISVDNTSGGKQLSERLLRILKSKTTLNNDELNKLTESDGWSIVYSLAAPKKEKQIAICFTGFSPADKEELTKLATKNSFHVANSVVKNLHFLCTGDNAGPSKIDKAKKQKTEIITKDQFFDILETGQLPNS